MGAPTIVLFDGECGLCAGGVQWILRRDRRRVFRFASLQSQAGRRAILDAGGDAALTQVLSTMVVISRGQVRTRSDAVLAVAAGLGLPWSLAACGRVLPRPLRDAAYRWVARRRHRWFAGKAACSRPTQEMRSQFLDADERGE